MFKRKDDKQDAIHHTNIKRGITSNFARMLKVLQQKHLQTNAGEYIFSNDASNNLCNSLEAVFLHGLKDSVTHKLTAYVGLAAPPEQSVSMNFWSVAMKFTHSDVATQLQSLSQINTEIGLCRAWIRLALNDGLMESYLHSMIVDVKTLKYFYHPHSYLRDHEQPGILKNYLTGLMSLDFKLSYNASVLNSWSNTTLQLIGILDIHQAPPPTISPAANKPTDPNTNDVAKETNGGETEMKAKLQEEPIVVPKNATTLPERNNAPMFANIRDVEELKRAATDIGKVASQFSTSYSEGSSSSHVSCPDPHFAVNTEAEASDTKPRGASVISPIVSPALYPRSVAGKENLIEKYGVFSFCDDEEEKPGSWEAGKKMSEVSHSADGKSERSLKSPVIVEDPDPLELAASPTRPRSRRVTDEDLKHLSSPSFSPTLATVHKSQDEARSTDKIALYEDNDIVYTPSSSPQRDSHLHKDALHGKRHKSPHRQETAAGHHMKSSHLAPHAAENRAPSPRPEGDVKQRRTYDEICATLPPLRMDAMEQEAILKKVLKEFDKQADKEREQKESKIVHGPEKNQMSVSQTQQENKKSSSTSEANLSVGEMKTTSLDKPVLSQQLRSPTPNSLTTNVASGASSPALKVKSRSSSPVVKGRSRTSSPAPKPSHLGKSDNSRSSSPAARAADIQLATDPAEASQHKTGQGAERSKPEMKDEHGHRHKTQGDKEKKRSSPDKQSKSGEKDLVKENQHGEELDVYKADAEDDVGSEASMSPGRFGNSLNFMSGWSSEIEVKNEQGVESPERTNKAESFASMLFSYAPAASSQPPVVTLDQVIETLPGTLDDEVAGKDPTPAGTQMPTSQADLQRHDSCLEDFEVLRSPSGSVCGQVEANSSRMIFLFRVPQEHGLSHQNFTCRGCTRPIGIIYGPPRLCEFDGGLYCYECHENLEILIPSSIVFDWDFRKKKVCRENYKFLQELEEQALYDIEELNPKLYNHVSELQDLKILRQQLCYLKSYLFTCSQKVAESLRQRVWPREHLYDTRDLYSVTDFLQVQSGTLYRLIKDLVKYASQHVYECNLCSQKGFVCEICRNIRVIYPFEVDTTTRCPTCKAVYHKTCMTDGLPCPKCERWGLRVSKASAMDGEHPEDYGTSPLL